MNARPTLICAALASLALAHAAARAGEVDAPPLAMLAVAPEALAMAQLDLDAATWDFAADELGSERVVKGAPYCADAVHETVQVLADGNRIMKKQQTRLCRDGEGRTRQEVERNGRKLVWLHDPVAKQGWLLDPARKTARRLGAPGHAMWFNDGAMGAADAEGWRAFAERAREQAREMAEQAKAHVQQMREQWRAQGSGSGPAGAPLAPQAPQPPMPPAQPRPLAAPHAVVAPVVVTRTVTAGDEGAGPNGQPAIEVQVMRLAGDGAPLPPAVSGADGAWNVPVPPPVVHWQALRAAPRGAGVTSALGSKDVEGLRANGERTTWTIEAGKIGNEKPIVISREVWTSPELLLTVLSRDADPRSGETVYRLANLRRGEPDPALMKVPADYASSNAALLPPPPPAAPAPRKPGSAPKG